MEPYETFRIFDGISQENISRMLQCLRGRQNRYAAGEVIREYDGTGREVGVLISGAAQLVRIDSAGVRTILEHLEEGNIFGEMFSPAGNSGDSVSVMCMEPCCVLFLDYAHIVRQCRNSCEHHSRLVHNMFALAAEQIQRLGQRVEVLSRRSIREKLLCYFALQSGQDGEFQMPYTFTALADYISTDRSAMMRELKKLREEGIVSVEGRRVTLLERG